MLFAQTLQGSVNAAYAGAILKVEVSAPKAVFASEGENKGQNICKSEGTAFLVGDNLAVTASHVYTLDVACGTPTILLWSEVHKVHMLAEPVVVAEDVTLLRVNNKLPPGMCSLAMSAKEVEAVEGVRFGIPKGMVYPTSMTVAIGPKDQSNFKPFRQLTPTPAEQGESGGPVVYLFDVVGVLRAKHATYPAFSVMTPITGLLALIKDKQIPLPLGGKLCNAAGTQTTVVNIDPVNVGEKVTIPADYANVITDMPATCPDCISVIKQASNNGTTTLEVRSHSLPPPLAPVVPPSLAFPPQSGVPSSREEEERVRNQNFIRVRQVSGQITAETTSRKWEGYVREMKSMPAPAASFLP
ncbi:hypothetical protein N7373_22360 [Achromobacter mucicolens]|uniref:hypothetical protein n=1 Tax=Achromobacter mucicolens TaxID=1389922 RepID=UPI002449A42F|nr:hypothetical protein [Achromobacter mucicolens]MDH0094197.1 hypothetical protein [Achromobacter mucicolens]